MNIRILVFEPGKEPYVLEIPYELKPMQELVGGYIETVILSPIAVLVCNEEGKILGLKPNRMFNNDILVGTFFIAGFKGEGFKSISQQNIERYKKIINNIE